MLIYYRFRIAILLLVYIIVKELSYKIKRGYLIRIKYREVFKRF